MKIGFSLNGKRVLVEAPPMKRLLDVLREDCALTGTKEGCGEGECGACTVLLDGAPVNSCLVPLVQARGAKVTTIEGFRGRRAERLRRAFVDEGGTQCGICTPGMLLAAAALPPRPTLHQIRVGLAGNLCRCTGYMGIYRAVSRAWGASPESTWETAGRKAAARPPTKTARRKAAARPPASQRARGLRGRR